MTTDTRESLALELAEGCFSADRDVAYNGGCGRDFDSSTTVDDFMSEAREFVDRCMALTTSRP